MIDEDSEEHDKGMFFFLNLLVMYPFFLGAFYRSTFIIDSN